MNPSSASDDRARVTVLVSGEVQGVGFRAFARRHALDLSLSGYVENLSDGRVEVVAEGHRADIELLLDRLRQGPAHAHVAAVEVEWGEGSSHEGFFVY